MIDTELSFSSHNSLEFKFDDSQQNQDYIRGWNVCPHVKPFISDIV